MPTAGASLRCGFAFLCASLCACVNQQVALEGDDTNSFSGGLRGSWELDASESEDDQPPASQTLVELELSTSSSDFDQEVVAGTVVEIEGTGLDGPTSVHADFDLLQATFDARLRLRDRSGAGLDLFGGLGFSSLDLDVDDAGGASASDSQDGLGPLIGLALFFEPTRRVRLFAEGSELVTFVEGGESLAAMETLDVGVSLRLTDAFGLIAGWRHLVYEFEGELGQSDYDLGASGPRLTLELQL